MSTAPGAPIFSLYGALPLTLKVSPPFFMPLNNVLPEASSICSQQSDLKVSATASASAPTAAVCALAVGRPFSTAGWLVETAAGSCWVRVAGGLAAVVVFAGTELPGLAVCAGAAPDTSSAGGVPCVGSPSVGAEFALSPSAMDWP